MIDSADTTIVTSDLENIEKLMSEDCKTAIFTHHHIILVYMQSSDIIRDYSSSSVITLLFRDVCVGAGAGTV